MVPIKGTAKGPDILTALLRCNAQTKASLVCVTREGALAKVEVKSAVVLLKRHLKRP